MRPLALSLQAFGPFVGAEQVDFRPLGASALFLIHGPTGAGKTSLLDAICYALYGESSGGERGDTDLRSDRADLDLVTRVVFHFALGGQEYQVLREPRQRRRRLRSDGQGSTEQPAKAEFHRLEAGAWIHVVSQPTRVSAEVQRLLGFSHQQFRQVVILPQGRFRDLLAASSRDREQIFEQLFQSTVYRRIEQQLKDQAGTLRSDVAALQDQQKGALLTVGQDTLGGLASAVEEAKTDMAPLQQAVGQARALQQAAASALQQGQQQQAHQLAADQAQGRLLALQAGDAAQARREQQLAAARRSAEVAGVLAESARLDDEIRRAGQQRTDAASAEARATAQVEQARQALAAARLEYGQHPDRLREVQELERLQPLTQQHEGLLAQEQAARAHEAASVATLDHTQQSLLRSGLAYDQAAQAVQEASQAADQHRALTAAVQLTALQLQHLQAEADVAKAGQEAAATGERAQARLQAAQRDHSTAEARLEDVLQRWDAGHAARLADALPEGAPCPVCGATDHPAKAQAGGDWVSEEVLRQAREAQAQALLALQQAQAQAQAAALRLAAARAQQDQLATLGAPGNPDGLTLASCAARVRDQNAELAALQIRIAQLPALQATLTQRAAQRDALQAALTDGQSAVEQHRQALLQATVARQQLEQQLPAQLRAPQALATALARARASCIDLEATWNQAQERERAATLALAQVSVRLQEATRQQAHLQAQGEAMARRVSAALQAAGFASADQAHAATLETAAVTALERARDQHQQALAAAVSEVERTRALVQGVAKPDLDALQAAATAAIDGVRQAEEALQRRRLDLERLAAVGQQLHDLAARQAQLETRFNVLGRLAEVADGHNPHRLSFHRYVLATLLDEVLEAASQRLLEMSRQRFALRRLDGNAQGRGAGGLDLEVLDGETGTARPIATLSGGEGFLAALSLALGLAQVVQSRSGGIHLDTLFIDEGFGTLDPESLDFAIRTLIDLQGEGRLVGIISHVTELRERIDARLEVRPAGHAQRLAFSLPAGAPC